MKFYFVTIFLLFGFYFTSSNYLQTVNPPVWPDEVIYSNVSDNIIRNGNHQSNLWDDAIFGIDKKAMWNPPLFFYTNAAWQMIWGISIEYQRLLVQIFAFIALCIIFFILKELGISKYLLFTIMLTWVTNKEIMESSRLARPEMFVLLYGLLSLFFLLKSIHSLKFNKRPLLLILSAFFSGLAILNHTLGIIFFLSHIITIILIKKNLKEKVILLVSYVSIFLLTISLWLVDIALNYHIFFTQTMFAAYTRTRLKGYIIANLLYGKPHELTWILGYLLLAIIILLFFIYILIKKRKKVNSTVYVFTPLLLLSWIILFKGKSDFYMVYPITITLISAAFMLNSALTNNRIKFLVKSLLVVIIITQIIIVFSLFHRVYSNNISYGEFSAKIASSVPNNSTVFLSVIPDPYYALVKKNIRIYEFPMYPVPEDKYTKLLGKADYIIMNGHYEAQLFGFFIDAYIKKHMISVKKIDAGGYSAYIFKMK